MRIRRKKNLLPRLDAVREYLAAPADGEKNLTAELGCGMGAFAREYAARYPGRRFYAVEKVPEALVVAAERAKAAGLTNVRFINADAAALGEMFAPGSIDELYVQFCDPWHKKKQAKRRLVHANFLKIYAPLLKGDLIFKTDNPMLAEFAREQFLSENWEITRESPDWRNDPLRPPDDIMTDYERKFAERGVPVFYMSLKPPDNRPK